MWKAIASDTLCSSDVSQRCAAAPQPGRFRQQFQGKRRLWLGREGSNPAIIRCHTRIFPFRRARLIPFLIPKQKPSSERGGLHRGQGLESERRFRPEHHLPLRELLWIKRWSFEVRHARRRLPAESALMSAARGSADSFCSARAFPSLPDAVEKVFLHR